jgi:hypothetical protein
MAFMCGCGSITTQTDFRYYVKTVMLVNGEMVEYAHIKLRQLYLMQLTPSDIAAILADPKVAKWTAAAPQLTIYLNPAKRIINIVTK